MRDHVLHRLLQCVGVIGHFLSKLDEDEAEQQGRGWMLRGVVVLFEHVLNGVQVMLGPRIEPNRWPMVNFVLRESSSHIDVHLPLLGRLNEYAVDRHENARQGGPQRACRGLYIT